MTNKNNNLFVASDQVRNSSENIIQNENATLGNVSKKSNSYTCFNPENLDLDSLIRTNPPLIPGFHIDYLVYVIGLLFEIPLRNKDIEMDFIPLNSKLIQRRVRDYRKYLDYLVGCEVILEDRQYINGAKSRGFKLTERFQVKTKPVQLTKKTLIKSVNEFKDINYSSCDVGNYFSTSKSSKLINQKSDLSYITNWLNSKLTVDYHEAEAYLSSLKDIEISDPEIKDANKRFIYRHTTLLKFHRGIFLPSEDMTVGRLHSTLTQIKGDIRPYIRYNGEKLVAVDIVNSQPYLSIVLLDPTKLEENNILNIILSINPKLNTQSYPIMLVKRIKEISTTNKTRLFIETVASGNFYEEFGLMLKKSKIIDIDLDDVSTRKKAKQITFSAFFSPNSLIGFKEEMKVFRNVFPNVYEIFKLIKIGKGHHNTLAILLQHLEATLVLHKACKIIFEERPDIPIFTLHDSIITTEGNEDYINEVLTNVLTQAIGIAPKLKVERWE
jgi:hypothetical protein